jgi:polysaccharide pyruvyl transferase WcaK-like protein
MGTTLKFRSLPLELLPMKRRDFFGATCASFVAASLRASPGRVQHLILRSSWQTVNIGDIAHTPGMLALLEQYLPDIAVTLWPSGLNEEVTQLLKKRFPKLNIAKTPEQQQTALQSCDFFLHGSGPGMVGRKETELAQQQGIPYGFGGITLSDEELQNYRELLNGAKFVFTRDTLSLQALRAAGIDRPHSAFGPDATFALDLRDDEAAKKLLVEKKLEPGEFLCAVPRLRWTPYWEVHPERTKPNPDRSAVNEAFAERDHAKMREAIIAWVQTFQRKVFLVPEMTYAVSRLKPLLYDPLPASIKPMVELMDRYWLTAEAASVYSQAAAVISFEMHSPIMSLTSSTPAMYLRQPTDTRKGQMWRDIGLNDWIFEIDETSGKQIADRLLEIGNDLQLARQKAQQGLELAQQKMKEMVHAIV